MARRPSCGITVDRMESSEKTITSPGRFSISVDVIAWKSNPWHPLRHGVDRMATTLAAFPAEARQRGQGTPYGAISAHHPESRAMECEYPDLGYSVDRGSIGVFGRKAVCTAVCTFAFGVRKRLRCLRTVRLRPDSTVIRMQPYAPYALPLKGKRRKKVQLPKEVHKVHTALCMSSQPYSRLASCSSRKSAYGLHTAAYEVHTDA